MKYLPTPNADCAAEIVRRAWGVKRQRNTNAFVGEPAYAYKLTRRLSPVTYKAYVGEMQWTLEAQGQEVDGKRFKLSFGEPFRALVLTAPYEAHPKVHGLDVFTFPRVDGKESPLCEHNSWLLSQADFVEQLKALRLAEGEMLAVTRRCLFAQLRMSDADEVTRRFTVFEKMLAWLRAVKS